MVARPLAPSAPADAPALDAVAEGTAVRLLDAAEQLFARHGIEGASVRAITQAADANIAAVHYHFGSKLDLVRALLERRIGEMDDRRRPRLDAALQRDRITVRDIADVWVRPLASMALDDGGVNGSYLSFLAVLQSSGPETRSLAVDAFRPQQQRFGALLERALPDLAEPVRWFRFSTATDATIHALADMERATGPWRAHGGVTHAELVDELVTAVAGMLSGPPSPARSRTPDTTN